MSAPTLINGVVGRIDSKNDLRWYVDPADPETRWPSVTTVNGTTHDMSLILVPWVSKFTARFIGDNLDAFQAKIAGEGIEAAVQWAAAESERIRNIKREIGTHQHDILEALLIDSPIPECPDYLVDVEIDGERVDQDAISDGLLNFLSDYSPTIEMAEATVANTAIGYAGTLDAAGWFPTVRIPGNKSKGARIALDLKTGRYMGDTARAQIVAYKNCDEVWVDDLGNKAPMPPVDMCGILHLRRRYKGGYKLYLIEPQDEAGHFDEFKASLDTFSLIESNKARHMTAFYPPLGDGSQPLPMIEDVRALSRCQKALIAAGVEKVDQLLGFTAAEVQSIKGVGPAAITACRAVLAKYDLAFAGEDAA